MTSERPFPDLPVRLLRLAKVTQKRGFSRQFTDGFAGGLPAVLPVVSGGFPAVLPTVLPVVFRRSSGSFASGLDDRFSRQVSTAVSRRFDRGRRISSL